MQNLGKSHSFVLSYVVQVRTGPRSFCFAEVRRTAKLTLDQARKAYRRLSRVRQVSRISASYA
jgi:hypothetical protein